MKFYVMTLFPQMIMEGLNTSMIGRALESEKISLEAVDIRQFSENKHKKVDDYPYGGGPGMVMQAQPIYEAYSSIKNKIGKKPRVVYLTPWGNVFRQEMAEDFAKEEELVFLCGHYEGVDERVLEEIVTDYVSIGDYVLTGGELASMVMIDSIARLIPGVLNNDDSATYESFHHNLLEHPQYSRPKEWRGREVPEVLLSGHHQKIEDWKLEQSLLRTMEYRPDLLENCLLTDKERDRLNKNQNIKKKCRKILAKNDEM
ncbi:MAG TPA: tRNA (guanosine(37)-N1)-methyltransferase TrmD [Candidatus Merdenecus merdavium]|nr:tRNA (guanosine(37)-N1)-methyltransferase TrmD [Candidatus Merdenecus merdavium]